MNSKEITNCLECGKELTQADVDQITEHVAKEVAVAAVEHDITTLDEMLSVGSTCAVIVFGFCLECFDRNNASEPLRVVASQIFADPSTNPILFQWSEVTGPL